jgi:hypothetical protein
MERIENAYLAHISECSEMARELSLGIFGREIPQIVDLHANALNAKVLAQVVERHAEVFGGPISLDTAMADPAYDTPNVFSEDRGASWLERWALERGVEVPSRVGAPDWVRDASRTPLVIQARRSAARAVRALRSGGGALLRGRSRAPYAT